MGTLRCQNAHDVRRVATRKGIILFLAVGRLDLDSHCRSIARNVAGIPSWKLLADSVPTPVEESIDAINFFRLQNLRPVETGLHASGRVAERQFVCCDGDVVFPVGSKIKDAAAKRRALG